MTWPLDARISRAEFLADKNPSAREALNFYRELAIFQKTIAADLKSTAFAGAGELARFFPPLLDLVCSNAPQTVAEFSRAHLHDPEAREQLLVRFWEQRARLDPAQAGAPRFFARVILEPYAEYLAARGVVPTGNADSTCPFCNARPVAAILRGESESGKRWLVCSWCATEWQFRRVLCPGCGAEDKENLPVFTTPEFTSVRIDACDICHTYIKSIDLTKDGHAVPVVDEIAAIPLDIWAEEHGYSKLEPNLLEM